LVNNAYGRLEPYDPAIFSVSGKHNYEIAGCDLKLDASANISLTGFSDGGIRQLACTNSQCIKKASDGSCAVTEYSFSAHLSVGDCKDTLAVAGGVDADFALCGYDIPRTVIDASFDSVGPGARLDLSVEHAGGANAKISKVSTVDLSWGVPANYKCGFAIMGIPALVGDALAGYCASLMNWVGDKVQGHLESDTTKLIAALLEQQVLEPPQEECPFYCAFTLCLLDACVNNCDYCSSSSSAEQLGFEQHAVATVPTPKMQGLDTHPGSDDIIVAFDGCQVPSLIFQGVRSLVNSAWGRLEPHDPASFSVSGNHSFEIASCDIKLDASANISLTGFSEGGIRQLACTNSQCIEKASDGSCAVTEYSFSAHLSVGDCKDTLAVAGGVDADFALCGYDIPRTVVDASFDSVGPGAKMDISVQHAGGANAKISKVNTLDLSWGQPTNYKCGFEIMGIPAMIGDVLADYCVSLMSWVADKIQGHLESDVEKLIKGLLNKQIL